MSDPSWPVQEAIYQAVKEAVSPVKVFDAPPATEEFHYVLVGDDTMTPDMTKTEDGHQITVTLHAWSRARGRKEVKALLATIYTALHDQPLVVDGFDVVQVSFEYADSFLDADGRTWHGVARYRVQIEG